MIAVELMGGMGNQMFQYALGLNLAVKHNTSLYLDKHFLESRVVRPNFVYRNYDLEIFNIDAEILDSKLSKKYGLDRKPLKRWQKIFRSDPLRYVPESRFGFSPEILEVADYSYLNGYWQSEKYFKENAAAIRRHFSFKSPISANSLILKNEIVQSSAVCLNVRRGDFLTDPILGPIDIEYYNAAVAHLKSRIDDMSIFVFSDDIEWCIKNLYFDVPTRFVTHEYAGRKFKDYLELMITCRHFIIPNSTFAWWAAWLAPAVEKMVIAPRRWFRSSEISSQDIIPERWMTL